METREFVQAQFADVRRGLDGVLADLTDEQLNWTPPGLTNVMSATLVHAFASEDTFIQTILQRKRRVWETGEWAAKTGSPTPPTPGKGWEEIGRAHV